ncbi:uncharacterized [Tachysurus ichikawai]
MQLCLPIKEQKYSSYRAFWSSFLLTNVTLVSDEGLVTSGTTKTDQRYVFQQQREEDSSMASWGLCIWVFMHTLLFLATMAGLDQKSTGPMLRSQETIGPAQMPQNPALEIKIISETIHGRLIKLRTALHQCFGQVPAHTAKQSYC